MKKLLIIILVILAIVAGLFYYLHQNKLKDFEPQIKEKLNKVVMDASNGLYHLEIGKLETDIVSSKITLINAHLRPDTAVYAQLEQAKIAPDDIFDVTISQISIDDVAPADFFANKAINIRRLFINKPVITVWHKKQPYNLPDEDSSKTVYERIQKDISRIQLDTLILQNVDFVYKNKSRKNKETRLSNVKLYFSDILIDSSSQFDRQRFLFAKNCLINLKDYTVNTSDSLYRFRVGDIDIQTNNKTMELKKLQFTPRVPVEAYYRKIKHQQDRFELSLDQVNFNRVNWWAILAEESFLVEKASMRNGKIIIFNDKSQPIDTRSKVGKYPHQLLMKLPFLLKLDTLSINNLDLSYTELNPKSGEKGTVYFDNIQGTLSNITNDPDQIRRNHYMKVSAKAMFMKKAAITAGFQFDLARYKTGNFSVTASVGAIGPEELNAITVPLGMLKVNSINIKSVDVSMTGDNYRGNGTVKMIYDDLKVTALKAADDTLKKRGLLSFIANTFVIKKENPTNNNPVRIEKASFERNKQRSFFNLVWKTIFTGAGKTAGYKVKK
ncbi:MAG: hypothetical protein ABIN89_10925 [Chitinophagaceae bacterium]